MGLGLLSTEQKKNHVIYLIFKGEEPVYIGLTKDYEKRVYRNHFDSSYRRTVKRKILYTAIDKYGEDAFEAFIYKQFNYRDEATITETELISELKGFNLARYNQYNYAKYVNGLGDISPYTKMQAKEERKLAHKELSSMKKAIDRNLEAGVVKDIMHQDDKFLYRFLLVRINYHNDKIHRNEYRSKFNYMYIDHQDKFHKENSELMRTSTFIPEEGSPLASILMFKENFAVAEYQYEIFIEGAKFTLDYLYEESTPLEQYVFTLTLMGYSDEDTIYELGIDEYEYFECIRNLSNYLNDEVYEMYDIIEEEVW